ncbi:hypothetical protein GW7_12904 [Heterocephalus glaber]|uniref:Uncharacterized protein n=1 Tax=Heterocephalus glaber TaxID=10181 RepID=G5BC42_HETGA|nr:hypothetical protein GW7_12904 [Heterocephalus glaber]
MLEGSEEDHQRLPESPVLLLPATLRAPSTQGGPNISRKQHNEEMATFLLVQKQELQGLEFRTQVKPVHVDEDDDGEAD